MFAKLSLVALAGFAAFANAAPTGGSESPAGHCNTGSPQCCNHVDNSSDPLVGGLIKALLGIDVSGLNIPIGQGCTALNLLGGVSW